MILIYIHMQTDMEYDSDDYQRIHVNLPDGNVLILSGEATASMYITGCHGSVYLMGHHMRRLFNSFHGSSGRSIRCGH